MIGRFETRRQRTGLEELRYDFARCGDDWHFDVERFQFQRCSLEIQAAQMRVAGWNPRPRPKDLVRSIDLLVCADRFKEKGRLALMFSQAKHDAKIITPAGRPRTLQRAFEFVGAQGRGKRVGLQTLQERLQVVRRRGVFLEKAPGIAEERRRG